MQIEEVDTKAKSCLLCKWFEQRSGFCRLNPPIPTIVNNDHAIALWPKITSPKIDFCSHFENVNTQSLV